MGGSFVYMIDPSSRRLSRNQRRKFRSDRKAQIALALAIALLILTAAKIYWHDLSKILPGGLFNGGDYESFQATADSLICRTTASFGLSDPIAIDSLLDQDEGPAYRSFEVRWPANIPFEFYVERLQDSISANGLSCSCAEDRGADRLKCEIRLSDKIGGKVTLVSSRKAGLDGRKLSFLVNNLGDWKNEYIDQMIKSGIGFIYRGDPDNYPTAKTRKALASAGVMTLLEFPGKKSGVIEPKNKKSKSSNKNSNSDEALVRDIFSRHPNVAAIRIDRSDGYDIPFVKAIIARAAELKSSYLYQNSAPDGVDSLAYSGGLKIINAKSIAHFELSSLAADRAGFIEKLIKSREPIEGLIEIDTRKDTPGQVLKLREELNSIGVKIIKYTDLPEQIDSF